MAQEFISKLNQKEGTTGYRLPTEAEWEYASRATTTTLFFTGECISTDQANYDGRNPGKNCPQGAYRGNPVRVGSFQPNTWGLYDMHGNGWEWVEDDWHGNYNGAPSDGAAWIDRPRGRYRVIRGGSWYGLAGVCRSANRGYYGPVLRAYGVGFRLSRSSTLGP